MRRTTIALAAVLSLAFLATPAVVRAGDDTVTEAVRALLAGAEGKTREAAERIVRADPDATVAALLGVTRQRAGGVIVALDTLPERRVAMPAPADGGEPVVQIYDVRDLTQGKLKIDDLVQRMRDVAGGGTTIETTSNGAVVVRATAARHDATREFLDHLRRDEGTLYEIDTRLIVAPMTATVGAQVMRARAGEVVDLENPLERVDEWVRSGDVQVLSSPRISCLRGQTGALQVGKQISYVADFDVEVSQSAFIADPVVDVVWDGVLAEFTAWPTAAGDIQLSLEVAVCDVEQPMETFQTSLGALNKPVSIQIPSFVRTELSRSLDLKDGDSALVRLVDGPDTRRLVLLTVRSVELMETEVSEDD